MSGERLICFIHLYAEDTHISLLLDISTELFHSQSEIFSSSLQDHWWFLRLIRESLFNFSEKVKECLKQVYDPWASAWRLRAVAGKTTSWGFSIFTVKWKVLIFPPAYLLTYSFCKSYKCPYSVFLKPNHLFKGTCLSIFPTTHSLIV